MNATERIFEYQNLEIENQGGEEVRASWPEEGRIEVEKLEVGYAEGLPSILKGLSFTAERNQRIGIVGRTGGGKFDATKFPYEPYPSSLFTRISLFICGHDVLT
jgi:ABC-type multidrug transport system fused ATPase/permease subunit